MAKEHAEFLAALAELRTGSADAIEQFIKVYGPPIQRIARRKLSTGMQSKFDSLDFVQMVWASFLRNPHEIRSFQNKDHLLAYLARLVSNKVIDEQGRRFRAEKRDVAQERPLEACEEEVRRDVITPSLVAIARETWDRLLANEKPQVREIVQLRLAGNTIAEIARQMDMNERHIRRVLERLLNNYERDSRRAHEDD